jgi:hypothetical protein
MSPGAVRIAVIVVCVGGIAGMIIGSVADNTAVALTCGLVTVAAVVCLIAVTAVTAPRATLDEDRGERVEARVRALVRAGADEQAVRALVREVMAPGTRMPGRGARRTHP